jgi:hypothetical protein
MNAWDRAEFLKSTSQAQGVDRDARMIRGYVVAMEGEFKTRRGRFTEASLQEIVRVMSLSPNGIKSRFAHPTESDDGLGKNLGRAINPRMDKATRYDGKKVRAVRADLRLAEYASKSPSGDLAEYTMSVIEEDPGAISSSLVLRAKKFDELDSDGLPVRAKDGSALPQVWIPTEIHASDLVDTGDAVDGILSALAAEPVSHRDSFSVAQMACETLDAIWGHLDAAAIRGRATAWLERYIARRFGDQQDAAESRGDSVSGAASEQRPSHSDMDVARRNEYIDWLHRARAKLKSR